jgi:predicted transcriptional regulator of viral defense system
MKPNLTSLYDIAENQAGYFTSAQARNVGYSWERLSNLTKANRFARIESGVYRLNNFPNYPNEDLFIAILKSGPEATLSHETALAVYELSDMMPGVIHINIPKNRSRRRKHIKYHNLKINKSDITRYQGLPITTVERAILDVLKSGVDIPQIERAIAEALERGLTTRERLSAQSKNKSHAVQKKLDQILERMVL